MRHSALARGLYLGWADPMADRVWTSMAREPEFRMNLAHRESEQPLELHTLADWSLLGATVRRRAAALSGTLLPGDGPIESEQSRLQDNMSSGGWLQLHKGSRP